jgi:multicomponent Na+:H+ antiporter subunit A
LSRLAVGKVETGLLRTYIIWVIAVASASGLTGYYIQGKLPLVSLTTEFPILVVLATSVAGVYAVMRSDTYISSVLTLSILGFMVSIFYLLMNAPDLVMTQLVVESLSLVIFLLVLNKLPEYSKKISFSRKYRDLIISGLAGLMVFASVIFSTMEETPSNLAKYYVQNALPGSGGTNVVNVILVDFRGLDTMGEISVILMSALSILMLFRMRGGDE